MSPTPDFLSNKPVKAGVNIIRTVSVTVLVTILFILTLVGLFGVVIHFRDHREVVLPKPTGPYAVGRVILDWTDLKREDPYSTSLGKHRELMVWLWYPASIATGSKPAAYIPRAWASELPWRPVTIPAKVRVHAVSGAPIASDQTSYPVLVFSTGFGNLPSDYTSLIEDIVSHGYVVLGITSTFAAPVVRFSDGRLAHYLAAASFPRGPKQAMQAAGNRIVKVWAADIRFVIDKLDEMNSDSQSRFYGHFDLAKVGLVGQSFGGASAAEACSTDSRCKAVVDIDGNLFGDVPEKGIQQPLLFILSDWTLRPPWLERTLASVTVRRFHQQQVTLKEQMMETCKTSYHCWETHIPGTLNFNFTDLAVLYSPGMRVMGYLGPVSGAKGLRETSSCVREFFGTALNGGSSGRRLTMPPEGCNYQPLGQTADGRNSASR